MNLLRLEDAVEVAVKKLDADSEAAERELREKCFTLVEGNPWKKIAVLAEYICPEEIGHRISNNELSEWCFETQTQILGAIAEMIGEGLGEAFRK